MPYSVLSTIARGAAAIVVALALTAGTLLVGATAPASAATRTATAFSAATSVEDTFTARINHARAARGIPRLALNSDLVRVARDQAARMAARSTLYHNPRLTQDVTNWRWVGENVGYGPDALTVHVAFMQSPGHRANILDRDYTQVGIGSVVVNGRVWVAEVFRQPMR